MKAAQIVAAVMHFPSMMTGTPIAFLVTLTLKEMKNLDYYDQMSWNQQYCEDTLFAFGSEDYLKQPARNIESTKTETLL